MMGLRMVATDMAAMPPKVKALPAVLVSRRFGDLTTAVVAWRPGGHEGCWWNYHDIWAKQHQGCLNQGRGL